MPSSVPASLSYASIVIGFISFAFTLSIFFGTFAAGLGTLMAAPHEVRDVLSNLRYELYEEREALRKARSRRRRVNANANNNNSSPSPSRSPPRRRRSSRSRSRSRTGGAGLRGGAGRSEKHRPRTRVSTDANHDDWLRIASETIKDLLRDFRRLERPFLVRRPSLGTATGNTDWDDDVEEAKTHVDAAEHPARYYKCDFGHRLIWLKTKTEVISLADKVQRVQITRIEREGHETLVSLTSLGSLLRDIDDRLWGIEDRLRMTRVAGGGGGGGDGGGGGQRPTRHGQR